MRFAVVISFLFFAIALAGQNKVSMNHYTTADGLSTNTVRCLFQDSKGFIWMGTEGGGLNKFDGYRFTVYDYHGDDPHSISNSYIYAITEDKHGNIWVGTNNGLNKLDAKTGKFQRFYHDPLKKDLNNNHISALLVDHDNILWIGTFLGLQKYDIQKNQFTDFSEHMTSKDGRIEKQVNSIIEDQSGNLWLAVWWGGLKKFNKTTGSFKDFYADPRNPSGLMNDNVLSLCLDDYGYLWVGNHSGGLRKLSLSTEQFVPVRNPENNINVWSISKNRQGQICYTRSGIGFINPLNGNFTLMDYSKNEPEGISSGYHYAVYYDINGILWLGSTEGLSLYSSLNKRFSPYLKIIDSDKRFYVTSFYKGAGKNELWMGTFGNGIIRMDETTGKYIHLYTGKTDDRTKPDNFVTHVRGDGKGQIWIATGNGIMVMDEKTGKIKRAYYHNPDHPSLVNSVLGDNDFMFLENDSIRILDIQRNQEYVFPATGSSALPGRSVTSVLEEKDSILWIGTNTGLIRYLLKSKRKETFSNPGKFGNSISGEAVRKIFRDSKGVLWVGTQNGLNRYDPEKKCFVRMGPELGNITINGITEDDKGLLWLLSEKDLTRFDPVAKTFRRYDENDGLTSSNNLYRSVNGFIYCNRNREGYYRFIPDSIRDNVQNPQVYISRFLLFNKEVAVSSANKRTPLKTDILNTREITLKHNQSMISFEFTVLNYLTTAKNTFFYKLEGFDNNWYKTDASHRIATYTNLNAGSYVFRVKAANSDGILSDQSAELRIKILPPPWKTWWAYLVYLAIFFGSLAYFRNNLIQREKLKNQIKMDAMEYERKIKMDEMKMRFFANISHEFRTPLTLILAPLHAIMQIASKRLDNQTAEHAGLIQRNANRLADLINQILDLQKLEAGSLNPEICEGNILEFVNNITEKFSALATQKNIQFKVINKDSQINGWFDPDKTEKIITNLLSNAFKFTRDSVVITVDQLDDKIHITVEDNGKGIPAENLSRIFDRFYHADDSPGRIQEGTGIGLALVKEMTELLSGRISVVSEVGNFTRFTLLLPLNKESFSNYTVRTTPSSPSDIFVRMDKEIPAKNAEVNVATEDLPLILIAEDNGDLRQYLRLVLDSAYRTVEAVNGQDGLNKAREFIPDLIISDILMPELDGVQMTQLLKNDAQTNHIPIILLTSLASTDSKLKGLGTGADDYITKPFNEEVLLLKIFNIILQRSRLQRFYLKKYGLLRSSEMMLKEPEIENPNEVFMEKMVSIIENHMDDPEFTNEGLAESLGLSVAVLYRKTNALVNCTPADFVRDLKIKRAVQLLNTGKLSVSEVATHVGFDDPHYFGKWFKKNVGKTPSEMMPF